MRLLHYVELQNFKRFDERQRIELDNPAVIIGPNNCGKTTAIQALALWSQAVKTWLDTKGNSTATERTATAINRLNIVAVPVQRTRYFWHNTQVRVGNKDVPLIITVGVEHNNEVRPLSMRFRNQGDELLYCTPTEETLENLVLLEKAAKINVELLYPMSGLETEEPILQPGRIDVLLGQGQTAQVLRNLCLLVYKDSGDDWLRITNLMNRLFSVNLGIPNETGRGSIDLKYEQEHVTEPLDISLAGRGFQQMLLIFAYLFSHKRSVLLIDEPDAHLEILRQKQVYVLLRDIAAANDSQVIMVTHSEVILDEALDHNLTLLLEGRADDLAAKNDIKNSLKHFGAEHYIKARERGYVLYVEGGTDLDMLKELAERLRHPVLDVWDERVNSFYVQNNYPDQDMESELERVEGGFGITPEKHFHGLKRMVGDLNGLAILDNDGRNRRASSRGGLQIVYWKKYEAENYFITPDLLEKYVAQEYNDMVLFSHYSIEAKQVMSKLLLNRIFSGNEDDFNTWKSMNGDAARLLWDAKTERVKLSDFAEEFFRKLGEHLGHSMILRKGELHRLIPLVDPQLIPHEVTEKLDLLKALFDSARSM